MLKYVLIKSMPTRTMTKYNIYTNSKTTPLNGRTGKVKLEIRIHLQKLLIIFHLSASSLILSQQQKEKKKFKKTNVTTNNKKN